MPSAAARRAYTGLALFSFGFRPFFLGAGVWATLALPLWLWAYMGGGPGTFDRDWHVHEMLFGYLAAVAAGFLLTAVPNWTGRMPVTGAPLAGLFGLWLAGRVAMLFAGQAPIAAASVDAAFLIAFAAVIWREVATGRNWRNLPVCLMVTVLAAANLAFHARWAAPDAGLTAERAALAAMAGLIALIGGRITPSFTRNWLMQRKAAREPAPFGRIDRFALGACVVGLVLWVVLPLEAATGAALALAGAGLLARLSRWRTADTLSEPLVWSLHLGYGWLGLALLLIAGSILAPDLAPRTAGVHALTAGAAGVMTLAVMTRATLGHTGRARQADRSTLVLYVLVNLAAVVRAAAPFLGELQFELLAAAGALWSAAFAVFVAAYGPILVSPRVPAANA